MNLNPIDGVKKVVSSVTGTAGKAVDAAAQAADTAVDTVTGAVSGAVKTATDTASGVKDLVNSAWDGAEGLADDLGDLAGQAWDHKTLAAGLAAVVAQDPHKAGEVKNVIAWAKDGAHGEPPTDDPLILTALITDQAPALGAALGGLYGQIRRDPERTRQFAATEKWLIKASRDPQHAGLPPSLDPLLLSTIFQHLDPAITQHVPPALRGLLGLPTGEHVGQGRHEVTGGDQVKEHLSHFIASAPVQQALHGLAKPFKLDLPVAR